MLPRSSGMRLWAVAALDNILTQQRRRRLHLAPPFLVDDYVPRYQLLSEVEVAKKRSLAYAHLKNCNLCPRLCGVNRYETTGMCLIGANVKVNVIAPHFGEEPCIQGHNGSGAVFFSGCNLRCTFCQNHEIAHQRNGFDLTPEELGAWYVKLQEVGGVHNINLVTPEHVVPQVALSVLHARALGLRVPVVYNTSAYDSPDSLRLLDGLVDVYLPDFKVWSPATSRRLLKAPDYAAAAGPAIREMHAQVGDLCFSPDGIAKRGLLVRHLVMPGLEAEAAEILRFLADHVSRDTFVNIMEQYRPDAHVGKKARRRRRKGNGSDDGNGDGDGDGDGEAGESVRYAEINRAVTADEVSAVRRAAEAVGLWRFCDPPRHDGFAI
ncbi:pyruvate formate lyase activating enzyme [Xylaria sp. FL1777]|nr:pyruvate formate lyase activating enzyme [Xylaria sp. FL1777]